MNGAPVSVVAQASILFLWQNLIECRNGQRSDCITLLYFREKKIMFENLSGGNNAKNINFFFSVSKLVKMGVGRSFLCLHPYAQTV